MSFQHGATEWDTGSIDVFRRDRDSGGLTHRRTIAQTDKTAGAACVRRSRDHRLAATAAFQSNSVLLWHRDSGSGKLVELGTTANAIACFDRDPESG